MRRPGHRSSLHLSGTCPPGLSTCKNNEDVERTGCASLSMLHMAGQWPLAHQDRMQITQAKHGTSSAASSLAHAAVAHVACGAAVGVLCAAIKPIFHALQQGWDHGALREGEPAAQA